MNTTNISVFDELKELALARKNMYGFLSRVFLSQVSDQIVSKVRDNAFLNSLADMKFENAHQHFKKFSEDYNGNMDPLNAEYSKLLVIPTKQYYVTPYESVYLTGLLSQTPTKEVKRIYDREGLEISQEFNDFPDHIGIELEYMHFLCNKEIENWESDNISEAVGYLDREKEFLKEHLAVWTPKLCERIISNSHNDFYIGMAELLGAFIDYDKRIVDESIASAKDNQTGESG